MKRRDFLLSSVKGAALMVALKFVSPFEALANNKSISKMRIATPEDAQAIVDYWNANLPDIKAECERPCAEYTVDFLKMYFESGFIVWEENNVMICVMPTTKGGSDIAHINLCWASNVSALNAGLIFLSNELNSRGIHKFEGNVKHNASACRFMASKGFPCNGMDNYCVVSASTNEFLK